MQAFINSINFRFEPWMINLIGLVFNLVGSAILSFEVLGASKFFTKWSDIKAKRADLEQRYFSGTFNTIFVFMTIVAISFILFLATGFIKNISVAVIFSPVPFILWKFLVLLSDKIKDLVELCKPFKWPEKGCLLQIFYTIWTIPWAIVFFIVGSFNIIIRFFIDLPFRLFAERTIVKLLYLGYHKIYKWEEEQDYKHIKTTVLFGFLIFVFGFLLQILAIIVDKI